MTRDELIAALEAATGPAWALDQAIWAIIAGWSYPLRGAGSYDFSENGANYTESIDAALTLVPEGCFWQLDATGEAAVYDMEHYAKEARHKTPAIALCIAALKAGA